MDYNNITVSHVGSLQLPFHLAVNTQMQTWWLTCIVWVSGYKPFCQLCGTVRRDDCNFKAIVPWSRSLQSQPQKPRCQPVLQTFSQTSGTDWIWLHVYKHQKQRERNEVRLFCHLTWTTDWRRAISIMICCWYHSWCWGYSIS